MALPAGSAPPAFQVHYNISIQHALCNSATVSMETVQVVIEAHQAYQTQSVGE